jgi:hypothetical protein
MTVLMCADHASSASLFPHNGASLCFDTNPLGVKAARERGGNHLPELIVSDGAACIAKYLEVLQQNMYQVTDAQRKIQISVLVSQTAVAFQVDGHRASHVRPKFAEQSNAISTYQHMQLALRPPTMPQNTVHAKHACTHDPPSSPWVGGHHSRVQTGLERFSSWQGRLQQ